MEIWKKAALKGLNKSVRTLWMLTRVIVPLSCLMVFLEQTSLLSKIAAFFNPLMSLLHLPGEAAIPVSFGFLTGLYAAAGAVTPLSLTTYEVTVIALILLISHELFIEAAICSYTGLKAVHSISLRLGVSLLSVLIFNTLMGLWGVI